MSLIALSKSIIAGSILLTGAAAADQPADSVKSLNKARIAQIKALKPAEKKAGVKAINADFNRKIAALKVQSVMATSASADVTVDTQAELDAAVKTLNEERRAAIKAVKGKAKGKTVKAINADYHKRIKALKAAFEEKTEVPTTEAPSTEAPSTEAPSTEAPTTEAPSTEAPTTEAPSTEAPSTEAPSTEAPSTEAPSTEAPATTEAPSTEAPSTEVPAL